LPERRKKKKKQRRSLRREAKGEERRQRTNERGLKREGKSIINLLAQPKFSLAQHTRTTHPPTPSKRKVE
jgi:hypothetical protein